MTSDSETSVHEPGEPLVRLHRAAAGVAHLELNQPGKYNALSSAMLHALAAQLAELRTDAATRVVVLSGAGRGFSAGHDLAEMNEQRSDANRLAQLFALCSEVMQAITTSPQPVIAQVHGVATAAGLQLAASCDLVIAADTARFALPGVNVGIFCSTPAVAVGRRVGRARTMELLLTGTPIDAATALSWGLVNRLSPAEQLAQATLEIASLVAGHSAGVVGRGKATFYRQMDQDLNGAYDTASAAMVCDVTSPDAAEGMTAFLAKRAPIWPR